MKFYDIVGDKVVIHADFLAIPCIKRIWDKYNKNGLAHNYISYIVLNNHHKSPYVKGVPQKDRKSKLMNDLLGDSNYVMPDEVFDSEKEWLALSDTLLKRLLRGTRAKLERVAEYQMSSYEEDLDDVTVDKIFASASKLGALVKSLEVLETQVDNEESTSSRVRGGSEINPLELPDKETNTF